MHSPETVAFEIKYPCKPKNREYRDNFITIWHVDPEKDGSDDSCGWFLRPRHLGKNVLNEVIKNYEFDWDRIFKADSGEEYDCGLFLKSGQPHFSVIGVTINLFFRAAFIIFKKNRKKAMKYINDHLANIIFFAENPVDSIFDSITRKFEIGCKEEYTDKERKERIESLAGVICSYIARDIRPWYKHPKWHIHHWKLQIHPLEKIKKFLFIRCCVCKKRFGWNESTFGSWGGEKVWHSGCGNSKKAGS